MAVEPSLLDCPKDITHDSKAKSTTPEVPTTPQNKPETRSGVLNGLLRFLKPSDGRKDEKEQVETEKEKEKEKEKERELKLIVD